MFCWKLITFDENVYFQCNFWIIIYETEGKTRVYKPLSYFWSKSCRDRCLAQFGGISNIIYLPYGNKLFFFLIWTIYIFGSAVFRVKYETGQLKSAIKRLCFACRQKLEIILKHFFFLFAKRVSILVFVFYFVIVFERKTTRRKYNNKPCSFRHAPALFVDRFRRKCPSFVDDSL